MPGIIPYILPTRPMCPPRAVIITYLGDEPPELKVGGTIEGTLATWSPDSGRWFVGDVPVVDELNELMTAHARNLGVDL